MSTNLELKIRCSAVDLARIERLAQEAGIEQFEPMRQVDTYFVANEGRLKLREITAADGSARSELIGYRRNDELGTRWSTYTRVYLDAVATVGVREALECALGVLVAVDKRRRVGICRRTRIHLDEVERLGAFVELETVTEDANDSTAAAELEEVAGLLGLQGFPAIAGSYSDLLLVECS